mgnify:CR=1 FL=1
MIFRTKTLETIYLKADAAILLISLFKLSLNPPRWEMHGKGAALAQLDVNVQLRPVALQGVFDDGQAQAGATGFARAAAVDAVEALGQPRQVVWGNAGATVAHLQAGAAIGLGLPQHLHPPACGGVAQGVGDEVGEGADQLDRCAQQLLVHAGGMGGRKFQLVCALTALAQQRRQGAGLDLALLQNVCHRHPLVVPRQRAAFQAREGEQILHQMVHALRLLAHEVQVALALLGWHKAYQVGLTVQGKFAKPDYCLLLEAAQENALIASKDAALITAICESKAWDKTLDTGKADRKANPHHQLQDYLSTLRVRFGFLTNGRIWRRYDTDKITAKKTYLLFELEAMCALPVGTEKTEALALFDTAAEKVS